MFRPLRHLCSLCLLLASGVSAAAGPPQRIVSINLCTDQLLMALVEPERIVSLSILSLDEHAAYRRPDPNQVHINDALPEEVIPLQPDLILSGAYTNRRAAELLKQLGYPVEIFTPVESLDGLRDNLRRMARLVGEEARGESLLAVMDERLAAASADLDPGAVRPSAAVYLPRGYSSGEQTLQGEALRAAGFRNAATDAGLTSYGSLPLEDLLYTRPDLLISSDYAPGTASLADRHLQHPVLRKLTNERPMAKVPYKLWICAGPWIAEAVEILADAREGLK